MSFVVYSIKGGVGKTTLSVQISQMLNYTYVTNDSHSSAHNLMPEEKGFLVSSELKEYLLEEINKLYDNKDIPILFVRESSVLEDSLFDCEYIETKAGANRFKRHIYRNAIEDMSEFKKLLEV